MLEEPIKAALVVLLAAALKWAADALGIPLDDAIINSLAGALVIYFLSLFGVDVARKAAPKLQERGLLKRE